jgi:NADPH:quinone reductase-like Zn-dependent oxidoreductase
VTVRVTRSGVIEAPIAIVWDLLRDFNGHDRWHPAIASSTMEAGDGVDQVGGIRVFRLKDGGFLREQLIALSDRDHSLSYCLLEAPVPLNNYVARMQLRPVTDGDRTLLVWESSFTPPPAEAEGLVRLVAGHIYEAGIAALKARFAPGTSSVPVRVPVSAPAPPQHPAAAMVASGASIATPAIVMEAAGGPEVLAPSSVDVLPPGPGEIRLQQTAIGVNFIDIHARSGALPLLSLPGVPGVEAAGVVIDVGAGVTQFRPGDRVVYAGLPMGAYAGCRTISSDMAVALPADIDDTIAAATFLKGMIADALVEDVHPLRAGETILVRAASGGVGLLLCRIARAKGARIIGVVSREAKASAARDAGCDRVVIVERDDLAAAVASFTDGQGVDAVFDPLGRDTFNQSLSLLALRGHLISFGQVTGSPGSVDTDSIAAGSLRLSRPNVAHYMRDRREVEQRALRLFGYIRQGVIAATVTSMPLHEAQQAHRMLESRQNIGSIILIPS